MLFEKCFGHLKYFINIFVIFIVVPLMNPFSLSTTFGPTVWYVTGIVSFILLEKILTYRPATVSLLQRWRINFTLNFCNVLVVDLFFVYLLRKTVLFSPEQMFDLFNRMHFGSFWRIVFTVLVLDLAIYIWHRLNHEIPFLWRFHRVHHTDLNIDISSAARFHFGEVIGSAIITYTLMFLLGATIMEIRLFQVFLFLMAQFDHCNIKLNPKFEKFLWLIVVPPAMHRIHHSNIKNHTDSNYGTIFSFWDRMFGTFLYDVDQDKIVFGLKEFDNPKELMLFKLLALPFRVRRKDEPLKPN